ncbi:hypothetical protein PAPYR_11235 [Paratrimastix pyriformis]|uniref:CCHC-type domain-containing protein n=1 Tax=Paratrimastix pyriformis TaxID=342808 RepID=A0ABQ8UBG3_9EUKA|nr:hypothetical protein PAPYR_11235 [Paratrimastix pyriformis]
MPNRDGIGSGLDIIRKTITMEKVDAMVREIAVFEAGTFQFWRANFWKDGIIGAGNAPWPVGIIMVENAACREKYPVDGEAYARMKEMMTRQAGVHFGDVGKTEDCCAMMAREVRKKVSRRLECLCNPRTYHKGECELAAEMGILDDVIRFTSAIKAFTDKHGDTTLVNPLSLISDDARVAITGLDDRPPTDLPTILKRLTELYRPVSPAACVEYLRTIVLHPSSAPLRGQVVVHYHAFKQMAEALGLPPNTVEKVFKDSFKGNLGRLFKDTVAALAKPPSNLRDLADQALKLAMDLDRLAELRPATTSSTRAPAVGRSTSRDASPARPSAAFVPTRPRDEPPDRPHLPRLTTEERERCAREGICFRCRIKGHLARDCPTFNTPPGTVLRHPSPKPQPPPQPQTQPPEPRPSTTAQPQASLLPLPQPAPQAPQASQGGYQTRYGRSVRPPDKFNPSAVREISVANTGADQYSPAQGDIVTRTRVSAAGLTASDEIAQALVHLGPRSYFPTPSRAPPHELPEQTGQVAAPASPSPAEAAHVRAIETPSPTAGQASAATNPGQQEKPRRSRVRVTAHDMANNKDLNLLIDTGAEVSVTSTTYAQSMGYRPEQCAPLRLAMADGSSTNVDQAIFPVITLDPQAPPRRATVYVINGRHPPDHIILGVPEIDGYAITVGSDTPVEWLGPREGEDLPDWPEPPPLPATNRKLQRWSTLLNEFNATVVYRPGNLNHVADCLSRLPGPSPTTPDVVKCLCALATTDPPDADDEDTDEDTNEDTDEDTDENTEDDEPPHSTATATKPPATAPTATPATTSATTSATATTPATTTPATTPLPPSPPLPQQAQ